MLCNQNQPSSPLFIPSSSTSTFYLLLICCFFGSVAFSAQVVFVALDLFSLGYQGISLFYLSWLMPAGLLLFPLFSRLKRTAPGYFIPVILVTEALGLLTFWLALGTVLPPWMLGLINAFIATGFWQLHHLALAGLTSATDRAFQIAAAKVAFQLGGVAGGWLGGLLIPLERSDEFF